MINFKTATLVKVKRHITNHFLAFLAPAFLAPALGLVAFLVVFLAAVFLGALETLLDPAAALALFGAAAFLVVAIQKKHLVKFN